MITLNTIIDVPASVPGLPHHLPGESGQYLPVVPVSGVEPGQGVSHHSEELRTAAKLCQVSEEEVSADQSSPPLVTTHHPSQHTLLTRQEVSVSGVTLQSHFHTILKHHSTHQSWWIESIKGKLIIKFSSCLLSNVDEPHLLILL